MYVFMYVSYYILGKLYCKLYLFFEDWGDNIKGIYKVSFEIM